MVMKNFLGSFSSANGPGPPLLTRLNFADSGDLLRGCPRLLLVLLSVAALVQSPSTSLSDERLQIPCDPHLKSAADYAFGYRERSNRCEGVYVKDVAGTPLLLASLTALFEDYDTLHDDNLQLRWSPPVDAKVNLRAYGLRRKLYYRMDALQPAGEAEFIWPLEVLRALNIGANDLGVVAWATYALSDAETNVFLPVSVTRSTPTETPSEYALKILPNRELMEVYLSLVRLDPAGAEDSVVLETHPLEYGFYPAERPISITLPMPESAGFYRISIGAELKIGGSAAFDAIFYHSDR
jgi:hypothetical protein